MNQVYLELKIDDILPQEMRAGELAQILLSLEDLIFEVVKLTHSTITKETLGIGLFKLENNSIDINVVSKVPELATPAYSHVTKVVNQNNFLELPKEALDPLREIHRITSSYERDVQFFIHNGRVTESASLSSATVIPRHEKIKTNATIFGRVIRVGGSEPRVVLERSSGEKIYCTVKSEETARELGGRLYEWVGVSGNATINPGDLEIEKFHVEKVNDYSGKLTITDTLNELKTVAGKYFSDINDVEQFVSELRC